MRIFKWIFGMSFLMIACSNHNKSINRVVNSYHDKSLFNPNWEKGLLSPEWYYRMTVVDTAPGSQALSVGDGNWLHAETIRFEITMDYLIGWRAHASVPGSENDSSETGKENYKGAPVVAFRILGHFDVAKGYDAFTSAKGPVIQENTLDRGWDKRRFMKVDFSKNLVQEIKRKDDGAWIWGSENVEVDTAFIIGQNEPANPKRSRFEDGYVEITTRQGVKADIASFYGEYGEPFEMDSSAPVIDLRYSFMRKPQKTNYRELNYTNDMFDMFGFYRVAFTGQQQWDSYRGSLESQKNYNVTRFNIWNEDGTPKPIIYYTNVSHPQSLMKASRAVESEWNRVFKELVFELRKEQYQDLNAVPDMWILRENDCNISNVEKLLSGSMKNQVEDSAKVQLSDIKARLSDANDPDSTLSFIESHDKEAKALDDLEKICTAFEYFTQGTKHAFRYQRSGDLRFNLLNLIGKRQMTSWSGLGPMFADMETGEIIQSQANVNLWYLDKRTQQAIDMMDMMVGKVRVQDLILGRDVQNYMSKKIKTIALEAKKLPQARAMKNISKRLEGFVPEKISPVETQERLKVLKSTRYSHRIGQKHLQNSWIEGPSKYPFLDDEEQLLSEFSKRQKRLHEQALGVSEPPEFLDNLVLGAALQYRGEPQKSRYLKIREAIYTAVALHEVGHNMGLTHNMSGSKDALNYGPSFWAMQKLPQKISEALKLVKTIPSLKQRLLACAKDSSQLWGGIIDTQDCLNQQEYMYSSIMDYHGSWNADFGGLGLYDRAAIFFGYGQLIEVFPENAVTAEAKKQGLQDWIFLNDWKKIPNSFVSDSRKIHDRKWISYVASEIPWNRVPYRFCIDASGYSGPDCKAFDFGPDMRTRAARNKTQYWNHYFLTHFSRDQDWTLGNDLSRVVSRDLSIFEDFNDIMRWYGYYTMTRTGFNDTDAGQDYLVAVLMGLNHFSHVIGHPLSGVHVSRLEDSKMLVPVGDVEDCEFEAVTQADENDERSSRDGFGYVTVNLGDGRPLAFGINEDYETYHLTYVGSFYAKQFAAYYLAYPGGRFPRIDPKKDPNLFRMSWYRLFPEEVSDIFSRIIRSDWENLGPLMDDKGELVLRDILDPETLERPDYSNMTSIKPASADMLPYRSLYYSLALLSIPQQTEFKLIDSMQIGKEGAIDDRKSAYMKDDDVIRFENPLNGDRYWAKNAGTSPIAYDYLKQLNKLKDQYLEVQKCSTSSVTFGGPSACYCTKTADSDGSCQEPTSVPCTPRQIQAKIETAKRNLEDAVGFIDDMRGFVMHYNGL